MAKAASASYYMELCVATGLCKKTNKFISNLGKKLPSLELIERENIEETLNKYKNANIYDFKDNSNLWYEYISVPERMLPPHDVIIKTVSKAELLITIYKEEQLIFGDTIKEDKHVIVPLFGEEEYTFVIYDLSSGDEKLKIKKTINNDEFEVVLNIETINDTEVKNNEDIINRITEMFTPSSTQGFDTKYYSKLKVLEKIIGKSFIQPVYKGGILEYLFYLLLTNLKTNGIIDEVFWNGKIGEFGIPVPAPGGKLGLPDIYFEVDNISVVLELTTIRAIQMQWSAEGSSVPDHIDGHNKRNAGKNVIGIFSAPEIYRRVEEHLALNARDKVLGMLFYPCILLSKKLNKIQSRKEMIQWLLSEAENQIYGKEK